MQETKKMDSGPEPSGEGLSFGPMMVAIDPERTRLGVLFPWHVMSMEMAVPNKRDVVHVHLASGAVTRTMMVYGMDIEELRRRVWESVCKFVAEAALGQLAQRALPEVVEQIAALSLARAGSSLEDMAKKLLQRAEEFVPALVISSLEKLAANKEKATKK